jgi:hypothetical protein
LITPVTNKNLPGTTLSVPGKAGAMLLRRAGAFVLDSGLIEGAVAGCALLVFVFVWQIFPPFSLVLAIGVYFGVLLVLHRPSRGERLAEHIAALDVRCVLEGIEARVGCIERGAESIPAPIARLHLDSIVRTARSTLAHVRERPQRVLGVRFVFDSLLDAAVTAVGRYEKFSRVDGPAAQRGRELLERRAFPTIAHALQQLLEQVLQDDLRTLNVDLVVLEQMLDLEGLSEAEPVHEDLRGVG